MREYERFSTAAMNCYVGPKTAFYLNDLESRLRGAGVGSKLRIMQSNGGVSTIEACAKRPIRILMSGPAGGVIGGASEGEMAGVPNVITVDIGGTSADISTIPGGTVKIMNPRDTYVGGHPVLTPMIDLVTIGAGGGSVAYIDAAGGFNVGPRSAGSEPGPACYGRGGEEPTVTDAQVVLGRLDPDLALGGDLKLDADLARKAVEEKVAKPLGLSVTDAALGILKIINNNMALAIRSNSVARGLDPRDFSIMPFGGAGPLHGVALAEAVSAQGRDRAGRARHHRGGRPPEVRSPVRAHRVGAHRARRRHRRGSRSPQRRPREAVRGGDRGARRGRDRARRPGDRAHRRVPVSRPGLRAARRDARRSGDAGEQVGDRRELPRPAPGGLRLQLSRAGGRGHHPPRHRLGGGAPDRDPEDRADRRLEPGPRADVRPAHHLRRRRARWRRRATTGASSSRATGSRARRSSSSTTRTRSSRPATSPTCSTTATSGSIRPASPEEFAR